MGLIRQWQRNRLLRQRPVRHRHWRAALAELPLLQGLSPQEHVRLRQLAGLLLDEKSLEPVHGLQLTPSMRLLLAAQAVLPLMHLGIAWLEGWRSLVLYPEEFVSRQEWTDEAGLVHSRREIRSGEAWERGPLVLSWADVAASGWCDGYNAVIHEIAHKLDGVSGHINGCPALHDGMRVRDWRAAFEPAFEDLCRRDEAGETLAIDPYATESPAEFFAVMSEHFFETPHLLHAEYPAVYDQLKAFYRQDPRLRLAT